MTDKELTVMPVAIYAMHKAVSFYHGREGPSENRVFDALEQWGKAAVQGHPSARILTSFQRFMNK